MLEDQDVMYDINVDQREDEDIIVTVEGVSKESPRHVLRFSSNTEDGRLNTRKSRLRVPHPHGSIGLNQLVLSHKAFPNVYTHVYFFYLDKVLSLTFQLLH